jgi:hypothetical protein
VSVVAAALALRASRAAPTVLVDLCGDLPAVLGLVEPDGPGVAAWSRATRDADAASIDLDAQLVDVTSSLRLLPRGEGPLDALPRAALDRLGAAVVVDAGCLHDASPVVRDLVSQADRSLLVTRACYLALRRAARLAVQPHGIVVIVEPGRALRSDDVAAVVGAPVVAELPVDASVARAVDAGLLVARCPRTLTTSLEEVA